MYFFLFFLNKSIFSVPFFHHNINHTQSQTSQCFVNILATVFGDPHIYTFDHLDYTFNGLGEYVLLRADSPRVKLDVQVSTSKSTLIL